MVWGAGVMINLGPREQTVQGHSKYLGDLAQEVQLFSFQQAGLFGQSGSLAEHVELGVDFTAPPGQVDTARRAEVRR